MRILGIAFTLVLLMSLVGCTLAIETVDIIIT